MQEMYGFAISCYKAGLPAVGLELNMMSQPPWDTELEPYYMLHYTYGEAAVTSPSGYWPMHRR